MNILAALHRFGIEYKVDILRHRLINEKAPGVE